MKRLGQLEPLMEPVKARIQTELGAFLQARAILLDARHRARTPEELLEADRLLGQQSALEGEMAQVLPPLQAGQYTTDTLAAATAFTARLVAHMGDVRALERQVRGLPEPFAWGQAALWGGAGLLAVALFWRAVR